MPVISAPGMLRLEDQEFKASLGYLRRPCLKKTRQKTPPLEKCRFPYQLIPVTYLFLMMNNRPFSNNEYNDNNHFQTLIVARYCLST
jgi:hypothetical protein